MRMKLSIAATKRLFDRIKAYCDTRVYPSRTSPTKPGLLGRHWETGTTGDDTGPHVD
jgi:hypothetical protein